jgi:hypothetical protein
MRNGRTVQGARSLPNAECGIRNAESSECGMLNAECGMNIKGKGVRRYEGTNGLLQCGVRNSECGIHVKCGTPRGYPNGKSSWLMAHSSWRMRNSECGMPNTQRVPECGTIYHFGLRIADFEFESRPGAEHSAKVHWYTRTVSPGNAGCGMPFWSLALAAMSVLTIPEAFPILEPKRRSRRPPLPDEEGFEDE